MASTLVVLRTYSFPHEAQLALRLLESEGIPAVLADENIIRADWLLSNAIGGVKLMVPEDAVEDALRVFAESDAAPPLPTDAFEEDDEICPYCGHDELEPITLGRRGAFLSWLLLKFPLWPPRPRVRCKACENVWKMDPRYERRRAKTPVR